MSICDPRLDTKARRAEKYRRIIDYFERVAQENIGKCVYVEDLCRIAGLNQRTLSRACREILGIGPYQHLRYLRLSEVKRLLSMERVSVTQAAMRFGFREPGKFAGLYKRAFGETPSETRRRRPADPAAQDDAPASPQSHRATAP
jgi:transcriptional regulator GlxA family with amidase domain